MKPGEILEASPSPKRISGLSFRTKKALLTTSAGLFYGHLSYLSKKK